MKPTKLLCSITIALTALALTACATNEPLSEWRDESFNGQLNNILIINVSSNSEQRYTYENKTVAELSFYNTRAMASYKILNSSLNLTREKLKIVLEGQQVDAILIVRLVGVREKEIYQLPDDYDYQRGYFGYYDNALQETNRGSYSEQRFLTLETSLYDATSGELVWLMHSETMDTTSMSENIENLIQLTTRTLARRGLIAAKQK
jgi:hypothetical protein